jgi:hypothetical protein
MHLEQRKNLFRKVICVLLLLPACKSSLKTDLLNSIDRGCSADTRSKCIIILKDVTKFRWDRMYLFGSWVTSDSISEMIGFSYNGNDVEDDYRRMLFTFGEKVVYEEDFKSLDSYASTLIFPGLSDSLHNKRVPYLTPKEAIFVVEKERYLSGCKDCFAYALILSKRAPP